MSSLKSNEMMNALSVMIMRCHRQYRSARATEGLLNKQKQNKTIQMKKKGLKKCVFHFVTSVRQRYLSPHEEYNHRPSDFAPYYRARPLLPVGLEVTHVSHVARIDNVESVV